MEERNGILSLFPVKKPILGMIHLKGESDTEIFEKAKEEIRLMEEGGIDGLMLENYVDYWLNKDGLLVRMDYFRRDSIIVDEVSDTISQLYVFELLDYNKEEIADF